MPKTTQRRRSELLVRCIPILRGHVRRAVADREAQHDVLQEVILTILSDVGCPEDTARFADYCRAVVHQVAAREQHRPEVEPEPAELLSDDDALDPDPTDPLDDPERAADTREELARAVDRLKDDALELLVRRYVLEENANELARDLAKSPASLRVRLMRLRSAARSAMR
jgi:RNA polymerase sigma factor (sigma-70 family)